MLLRIAAMLQYSVMLQKQQTDLLSKTPANNNANNTTTFLSYVSRNTCSCSGEIGILTLFVRQ